VKKEYYKNTREIQKISWDYFKNFYLNKLENIKEMGKI
jgi:hypothetical protein